MPAVALSILLRAWMASLKIADALHGPPGITNPLPGRVSDEAQSPHGRSNAKGRSVSTSYVAGPCLITAAICSSESVPQLSYREACASFVAVSLIRSSDADRRTIADCDSWHASTDRARKKRYCSANTSMRRISPESRKCR